MKKLLFVFLFIGITSCNSQNCEDISRTFTTYKEVVSLIDATNFTLEDDINTSKSSWISKASYYSCDNKTGFFVLKTIKKKTYVFEQVPISVWNQFKNADSFGKFYNSNIRNKYHLYLD